MNELSIFMSITNFVCILIIFTIILYIYGRIVDNDNNIIKLFEYASYNEIQLKNLVKDVNHNDKYLSELV